jgi:hypothetical protein
MEVLSQEDSKSDDLIWQGAKIILFFPSCAIILQFMQLIFLKSFHTFFLILYGKIMLLDSKKNIYIYILICAICLRHCIFREFSIKYSLGILEVKIYYQKHKSRYNKHTLKMTNTITISTYFINKTILNL